MYVPGFSKGRKKKLHLQDFCPYGGFLVKELEMVMFWPTVVNFVFRTFWADLALLCVKM